MTQPLIVHNATAAILFFSSVILLSVLEFVLTPRLRTRVREDWTAIFAAGFMIAAVTSAGVVAWFRVAPLPGDPWLPTIVGLILMWSGFAFRIWAILSLGRFFQVTVVVQEGHRVIESGPYRWLRHPAYLGSIATLVGIGVADGDWASIALALACALIGFLVRIQVEERTLLAELGEDYAAFAKSKARLVPGLY